MFSFENKVASTGILYSRYIVSWIRVGGSLTTRNTTQFRRWLETLGLKPHEVVEIFELATNGICELECNAKVFMCVSKKTTN